MYQKIHETIKVAGVFDTTQRPAFTPKRFLWRNRRHSISEITLTSDSKDGGVRKRYYGVMAHGTLYRLCYNRETEQWLLEEVWCE